LNDWNECIAKAKLDDICADYFVKQKRRQAKKQVISGVVIRREIRDSGAKSGRERPMYTSSSKKLWLSFNTKLKWET